MTRAEGGREVIFEIVQVGEIARVAAIDVKTGTEVVIQGPASAARADLEALASRKLAHVLKSEDDPPAPQPRPGKLV